MSKKTGIESMSPEAMASIFMIGIERGLFKTGAELGMNRATEVMDQILEELKDAEDGSQIAAMHAMIMCIASFLMTTGPSIKAGEVVASSAIKCAEAYAEEKLKGESDDSESDDSESDDSEESEESNNPFEW